MSSIIRNLFILLLFCHSLFGQDLKTRKELIIIRTVLEEQRAMAQNNFGYALFGSITSGGVALASGFTWYQLTKQVPNMNGVFTHLMNTSGLIIGLEQITEFDELIYIASKGGKEIDVLAFQLLDYWPTNPFAAQNFTTKLAMAAFSEEEEIKQITRKVLEKMGEVFQREGAHEASEAVTKFLANSLNNTLGTVSMSADTELQTISTYLKNNPLIKTNVLKSIEQELGQRLISNADVFSQFIKSLLNRYPFLQKSKYLLDIIKTNSKSILIGTAITGTITSLYFLWRSSANRARMAELERMLEFSRILSDDFSANQYLLGLKSYDPPLYQKILEYSYSMNEECTNGN